MVIVNNTQCIRSEHPDAVLGRHVKKFLLHQPAPLISVEKALGCDNYNFYPPGGALAKKLRHRVTRRANNRQIRDFRHVQEGSVSLVP
ncbi:MAG: hypothetical protein A4E52_01659 [Pelotomaculum sp. PtaB.Bin013]|nr:MAG: hypothetical protein A4E52_01659 [Pelotomaculum sp. PtaB.Bin013]